MERLGSWLSPEVMYALGWALIHSLWQCLAVAALAAGLMVLSRRPNIRYVIALGALALTLAAPVATFFVLMRPTVPVQALPHAGLAALPAAIPGSLVSATGASADAPPAAAPSGAMSDRTIVAFANSSRHFPRPDILPWLVGAWLCGVVLLSLRLAGGFLLLEHRRRSQSGALSPRILAMCQEVQRQLGLDRAIQYLECNWLQTPAVVGWLRPIVFLPVSALTGLSEAQLRAVIAHELAHIRRLDAFVNLFQILTETLLFYHPAVWWLNRRIRADRELCCDEIAVSATGNRLEYAHALTRIAEWKNTPFLAMAASGGPLSERIFHILGRERPSAAQRMLGLTGSVLFLAAALGAANALFGIAYPIPVAHAKAKVNVALVSSQAAVDRIVRQVLQPSESNSKGVTSVPGGTVGPVTSAQDQSARPFQPEKLVVPSPDLSRLMPTKSLATSDGVALDDASSGTMGNEQPAASPRSSQVPQTGAAVATNDRSIAHVQAASPTMASSGTGNAPHPKTEAGLRCLLGLGLVGCETGFANRHARETIRYCADQNWSQHANMWLGGSEGTYCTSGPLESIEYLGTNAAGEDVYSVRFMNLNSTYILPPPGPDGKIATRCKFEGPAVRGMCLGGGVPSPSAATVTSPAGQHRILYTRPAQWTGHPDPVPSEQSAPDQHASSDALGTMVAANDQPVAPMQPATRDSSIGPVQAALSTPPATLPKPNSNEPYVKRTCTNNNTITGRVTSSTTIQIPKFACDTRDLHEDGGPGGAVFSFNSDPCKNPGHGGPGLPWWSYCPNTRWFTMTVQFANPADASKMPLGKLVTLKGDFSVITQNKVSYLFVHNAKVLYADPFGR